MSVDAPTVAVAAPLKSQTASRQMRNATAPFSRSVATLLGAGVALDVALELAGEGLGDRKFDQVAHGLALSVRQGQSFSEAIARTDAVYGELFGPVYVASLRAGEASGNLAETLAGLARGLENSARLRREILSALIYPCFLMGVTLVSMLVIIGVVLPRLEGLFAGLGAEMPWAAATIIAGADLIRTGLPFVFGAVAIALIGVIMVRRSQEGQLRTDRMVLELPLVGSFVRRLEMERFCTGMASLLRGGASLSEALALANDIARNRSVRQAVSEVVTSVRSGGDLSKAMAQRPDIFSNILTRLVAVGLETGKPGDMFAHMADMLREDIEVRAKRLTAVLEPSLVLGIGVFLAFFIVALFQAILGLNQAII